MLPCISIGTTEGGGDEADFDYDSYSYQTRIRYLENRLDAMDRKMNTTGINIIGPLAHIQETVNKPSTWEVATRSQNYGEFNYLPYIFHYDDSGNDFYFDFSKDTYEADGVVHGREKLPLHHNVLHKGVWYDISAQAGGPYLIDNVANPTVNDTGVAYSGTYKVLSVGTDVKIAKYPSPLTDWTDISWSFTNPGRIINI